MVRRGGAVWREGLAARGFLRRVRRRGGAGLLLGLRVGVVGSQERDYAVELLLDLGDFAASLYTERWRLVLG